MKKLIAIAAGIMMSMTAQAEINFGTGGLTGNYFGMANDIDNYCGADFPSGKGLNIQDTGGSIENLDGMTSKKYSLIWVQEDVLQFNAKNNGRKVNEKRMRVVMAGQPETLHLIVPKGYKPPSNKGLFGALDFFSTEKPISLSSLKGQTVGAWGGSLVSNHALSHFASLGLNIVEVPEAERTAPKVPVLIVGGQPYAPVQALLNTGKYMMLPVESATLEQRAPFYSKIKANYVVNGKLVSIPTFSVRALLVGKNFRKAEKNEDMIYLAECLEESLPDLADDPDTNSNWETVYEMNSDEDSDYDVDWKYFN